MTMRSRTMRRVLAAVAATTLPVLVAAGPAGAAPRPAARAAVGCSYGRTPVAIWSQDQIATLKQPGRHTAWVPGGFIGVTDSLLVIVDDAPNLAPTQMWVGLDLNPRNGVTWDKAIEFWGDCKRGYSGKIMSFLRYGAIVSADCQELTAANDYWSGCTYHGYGLIDRSTTSELWFRKPAFLGVWVDAMVIDSNMWDVFGGRAVRFVWYHD